jgi:hypothetical protein
MRRTHIKWRTQDGNVEPVRDVVQALDVREMAKGVDTRERQVRDVAVFGNCMQRSQRESAGGTGAARCTDLCLTPCIHLLRHLRVLCVMVMPVSQHARRDSTSGDGETSFTDATGCNHSSGSTEKMVSVQTSNLDTSPTPTYIRRLWLEEIRFGRRAQSWKRGLLRRSTARTAVPMVG